MGRSAAFGLIINRWAVSQAMALLYNDGPLCGPFPISSKHPEFGEYTLYSFYIGCDGNVYKQDYISKARIEYSL